MARFNFSLDDDAMLDNLQRLTKRTSKADVVRDALSLYNYLIGKSVEGESLFLGREPGHVREVTVTTIETARVTAKKDAFSVA
jgi:hypothetical protein